MSEHRGVTSIAALACKKCGSAQFASLPFGSGKMAWFVVVRRRINRFNAEGLGALEDYPRRGRPATYTPKQVAAVIAVALTKPETLGLPFACWTLDRLAA